MIDDDDFFEPIREDLSQMPAEHRAEYMHLRDLAALKGITVRFELAADGAPCFAETRYGQTGRHASLEALKVALAGHGLPLISADELQRRMGGLFGAFAQAVDDSTAPDLDH